MNAVRNGTGETGSAPIAADTGDAGHGPSPVYHGGNLAQARAEFPDAPEPWVDLSTGINPAAYPIPEISATAWTRLPEPAEVARLEQVAAEAFGMEDASLVAATPGTQALIQMLPRLMPCRTVGILGFTYQEHARVWREAGAEVTVVDRLADLARFDVALVVNPNNPDGRLVPAADLAAVAFDMVGEGRRLIVDEAFVDVLSGDVSLAPRLPLPGVVVLRSFGKTWGLAGVRLGFALADAAFSDRVRAAFGPWAVSGPAIDVGIAAYGDRPWLAAARERLVHDAARLDGLLEGAGLRIVGGTPLFRTAEGTKAPVVFRRLGEAGVWVRRFPAVPSRLRLGIPSGEGEWRRLAAALAPQKTCP